MKYFEPDVPNQLRNTDFNVNKREYENYIRNTDIDNINPHKDRMVALYACGDICESYDTDTDLESAVLHKKITKVIDLHKIDDKDLMRSF